MSITETIAKNSVFNFIATASESLAALAAGIVLARYLGSEQYGVYALLMSFLSLATIVVSLGMGEMVKRFVAEALGQQNSNAVKGYVRLNLVVRAIAALLTSLIIIGLADILAKLYDIPTNGFYFMLIAASFIPMTMFTTFRGIFAGFQKYEYSALLFSSVHVSRAVFGIIIVLLGYGIKELLILYIFIWIIGMIFGFFLLSRLVRLKDLFQKSLLDSPIMKSAMKYSLAALGILGVDYFLWQNAEVLLLGIFSPSEEVGFYNIAFKIPSLTIALIPFVFGQVLLPAVSEQYGRGDMGKIKAIYSTSARYLMMISFPIAAVGIALAAPIIELLYGPEYAPSVIIMQIAFIPFGMRGLNYAVSSIIYGVKEPTYLLKIGIGLVIISIGLNFWLIPIYGAIGAVIATSIPRMLALPLYIRFVSKRIGEPWPLKATIRTSIAAVGMGVVAFLIQLYLGTALGLGLGIPLSIIVYIVALLLFGAVRAQDISMLRQIEKHMPTKFRRIYIGTLDLINKFVKKE
jgi:stage V sporulation protein B